MKKLSAISQTLAFLGETAVMLAANALLNPKPEMMFLLISQPVMSALSFPRMRTPNLRPVEIPSHVIRLSVTLLRLIPCV
ncbi:hypothetical protein D9M70_630250 [compost metagenome]